MTHSNGSIHSASGALFEIQDLHVAVEGREILRGFNLEVGHGEVHALMGRNGSGKSTLANALMGHPKYLVSRGSVRLGGEDILALRPDERAKRGIAPLPATQAEQEAALTGNPRIPAVLGDELLGAFLAVRRSDAAAGERHGADDVLAGLRWRY